MILPISWCSSLQKRVQGFLLSYDESQKLCYVGNEEFFLFQFLFSSNSILNSNCYLRNHHQKKERDSPRNGKKSVGDGGYRR